ncbi:hypothetical protein VTO42DRAFT_3275 [Malbranchea cinnamomea]
MSESPRSEKCETRYSTPVPELDDHRFQAESLPRADGNMTENMARRQSTSSAFRPQTAEEVIQRHNEALREAGTKFRDFEQAVVDEDDEVERLGGRRLSVSPRTVRNERNGAHHEQRNRSPASVASSRSSSPPNSVDAFAEPRRRERANTMDSRAPTDLGISLHRTVSTATHARRPTFSNASIVRPDGAKERDMMEEGDVCFVPYEEAGKTSIIDFEELEEFVALQRANSTANGSRQRKHSLSSQSRRPQVFYDMRTQSQKDEIANAMRQSSPTEKFPAAFDRPANGGTTLSGDTIDEKKMGYFEPVQACNQLNRFSFFSSECETTVHAAELGDLVLPGERFRDLFQLGPDGGVWWLDVLNPTRDELGAISRAFSIHPLTTEDIQTQEAREKVELFKQYYFVCFRTFYQVDKSSDRYLEPVHLYMVVFREGVLSFSFAENPHAANVRKRIGKLRDYVSLSSDWICYAMIDDIVDSFGPVIRDVERESEAIEDHVYVARVEDFNSFLPRIGGLRKKVMSLMRLLGGKADVIKGFSKRCNEQYSVTPRGDIGLYLGDIQDHVVTMMSNLGHFEKMLSRSHSNYLAQLNVTNIMLGNHVNEVLSKITFLGSILVPLNLICGLFGMNVPVPGQDSSSLAWFFGILGVICVIVVISVWLARRYKLL